MWSPHQQNKSLILIFTNLIQNSKVVILIVSFGVLITIFLVFWIFHSYLKFQELSFEFFGIFIVA
jgi:uncharacterized protein HemY